MPAPIRRAFFAASGNTPLSSMTTTIQEVDFAEQAWSPPPYGEILFGDRRRYVFNGPAK